MVNSLLTKLVEENVKGAFTKYPSTEAELLRRTLAKIVEEQIEFDIASGIYDRKIEEGYEQGYKIGLAEGREEAASER